METILVTAIAVMLFAVVYRIFNRGMELADSSARSIGLQQGARSLMENLVRDVNTCHMWWHWDTGEMIVLKDQTDRADVVVADNLLGQGGVPPNPTYPFFTDGAITQVTLPVVKCKYLFDPGAGTVTRIVTQGFLAGSTPDAGTVGANTLKIDTYQSPLVNESPVPGELPNGRVLASNVKKLEFVYFGYDDGDGGDGTLKEFHSITARDLDRQGYHIAMVVVHFQAAFDEGYYHGMKNVPEIEMLTKIWSYKQTNDHVYQEYFSSQDDDTRF